MKITKIKPAFQDDRGSIYDMLTDESIDHVGFLKSKKNSIRGKHYHKIQKQYTLVMKGKIVVETKNLLDDNANLENFTLNEMEMVLFPPYCYHSIQSLEDSECIIFTSKSRKGTGYEDDTFRIQDIQNFKISNEK